MHDMIKKLPVYKQLDDVAFDAHDYIALASTGSGKTLVLPEFESKEYDKTVLMRQPTRLATNGVYSGLQKFWPELDVGISTRDRKENVDAEDVIVYSDGSLPSLLRKHPDATVYIDEVHNMGLPVTEVEIALCRAKGIPLRLLSATIDPKQFHDYLPGLKEYELTGRTFPITKRIETIRDADFDEQGQQFHEGYVGPRIIEPLLDDDERAIVFLPTKDACEEAARQHSDFIETTYAHGEVYPPDLEEWVDEHADEPFAIFATVAAATSITIDVGRVFIYDEKVDSVEREGVEHRFRRPIDNNTLLQMSGRAGRMRDGEAILITKASRRRDWDRIEPEPIQTPCGRTTPYEVIMTMASLGLPVDTPLLSTVSPVEMTHAGDWLRDNGCIEQVNGGLGLTRLGRRIQGVTLPVKTAHLCATTKREHMPFVTAAMVAASKGLYMMLNVKPGTNGHRRKMREDPSFEILPQEFLQPTPNIPFTMGLIMRGAYLNSSKLAGWARDRNLSPKMLRFSMREYEDAAMRLGIEDAKGAIREVVPSPDLASYIAYKYRNHPTTHTLTLSQGWGLLRIMDAEGRSTADSATVCGVTKDLYPDLFTGNVRVTGTPKFVTSRNRNTFAVLESPVVS